jgi:hypothetical protein
MKYLIIIFLFTISAIGQDLQMTLNTEGKLECLRVTDSLSLSRHEIYEKTLEWVAITYQNSVDLIQTERKDEMILLRKASSDPMEIIFNRRIGYTLRIDIKDNKSRMRISDIVLLNSNNYSYPIEIILKNGKFRSSIECVKYRKSANEEFSKLYKSYLDALSDGVKTTNVW